VTEAELLARGKVIYLTFDDGPSEHTPELLDILERYQVKATFFVTNGYPEYVDGIGEAARRGHSIGIHCYSHWYEKIYASEDAYLADMKKMDNIIFEQTGKRTKLMRFPGGSSNKVSKQYNHGIMTRLEAIIEGRGYHYFDWNVDSNDAGGTTETDQVAQNVISVLQKKNIAVVLQHDSHGYSVAAVEKIICWGLENGYVFLPLTEESPGFHHGIVN
jgi:peptidoglycan/xylan/chitin deacetylase (PgdA/CDA1 family)